MRRDRAVSYDRSSLPSVVHHTSHQRQLRRHQLRSYPLQYTVTISTSLIHSYYSSYIICNSFSDLLFLKQVHQIKKSCTSCGKNTFVEARYLKPFPLFQTNRRVWVLPCHFSRYELQLTETTKQSQSTLCRLWGLSK